MDRFPVLRAYWRHNTLELKRYGYANYIIENI